MSIAEIKLAKALAKGELVQYLSGHPSYAIQDRDADLPTDYNAAFNPLDKRLKDDPQLQQAVVDAILSLANDPEYGWGVIFHVTNLVHLRRNEGIDLLSPSLLDAIASSLRKNRDAYKSLKRWVGKEFKDGVWEMVRVENKLLHKNHGVTVLPEEL